MLTSDQWRDIAHRGGLGSLEDWRATMALVGDLCGGWRVELTSNGWGPRSVRVIAPDGRRSATAVAPERVRVSRRVLECWAVARLMEGKTDGE